MTELILVALAGLALGALIGWLVAGRRAAALAQDLAVATTRAADFDIVRQARDAVERERNEAQQDARGLKERMAERELHHATLLHELAELRASHADIERKAADHARALAEHQARGEEREIAHRLALEQLGVVREQLSAQFGDTAAKVLASAQDEFLKRADAKFSEAHRTSGEQLGKLLQPVEITLKRYEQNLGRIEKEREGSYRELNQAVVQLAHGNAGVVREAQRLTNVLRSSPKARGRWGEEQLRTILESAGLAENVDFTQQTSVSDGERQLRPDFVVNLPGERCIVIDVKCPLVAFEQAFDEEDEARRSDLLLQHASALRSYANDLGRKGYWRQFDRSPDFVIMFVPGEHHLSAAAERAPKLIEEAFTNGVIIASTINMLALAKIMAGMWRQEVVAEQAKEIADTGKELFARLVKLSEHVTSVGTHLGRATESYNSMVSSLERNVYTSAQRLERLGIDRQGKELKAAPALTENVKALSKLVPPAAAAIE